MAAVVATLVVVGYHPAGANGLGPSMRPEPATLFERFILGVCAGCVRDSFPVATLGTTPSKLAGVSLQAANAMSRPGEIRWEVLRAHPLGRPSPEFLAARVTLWVTAGAGQLIRIAAGLVDEENVAAVATAVAEMSRALDNPQAEPNQPETTEMEFHTGSIRLGVIRHQGAAAAYLQAGDLAGLDPPSTWDARGAVFFPVSDLQAFRDAMLQAAETMQKLRSR